MLHWLFSLFFLGWWWWGILCSGRVSNLPSVLITSLTHFNPIQTLKSVWSDKVTHRKREQLRMCVMCAHPNFASIVITSLPMCEMVCERVWFFINARKSCDVFGTSHVNRQGDGDSEWRTWRPEFQDAVLELKEPPQHAGDESWLLAVTWVCICRVTEH